MPNVLTSYRTQQFIPVQNQSVTKKHAQKSFGKKDVSATNSDLTFKQKTVIMASSALGVLSVVAFMAKRKGFSLNPKRIMDTPIKDWAIFKYSPIEKSVQYDSPKTVIPVAAASVLGGFVGGCIVDKQNIKAKKREFLSQLFGNVITPISLVGVGTKLFKKHLEERLVNMLPKFKSNSKLAKRTNMCIKNLPNAVFTLLFLTTGVFIGNRVSNFINEKIYKKKVDRNIRPTDFAPHVDDLCMATSMMNEGSEFGSKVGRVVPLALVVPGYETGIARD